jgi:integrase/recombinase XerD
VTLLAPTLQAFFTTRLTSQFGASPHTLTAYRDTWRLLLRFIADTSGKPPQELDLATLTAEMISDFLTHLETVRGNSVTTRNARLAAIHSFFGYAAYRHPEHRTRSARSWPSRRNDTTAPTSPTSPHPR